MVAVEHQSQAWSDYWVDQLVTNAEYQRFIDAMKQQNNYVQPDHWVGNHYPAYCEDLPVVGVRASDAAAYCRWLNNQQGKQDHCRLPAVTEAHSSPDVTLGYWCLDDKQRYQMVVKTRSSATQLKLEKLVSYLSNDLGLALALARAHSRHLDINLPHGIDLALERASVRGLALDTVLEPIYTRIRANKLIRMLDRAHGRVAAHDRDLVRALDIDRDLANALENVTARAEPAQSIREYTRSVLVIILDVLCRNRPQAKRHLASNVEREQIDKLLNEYFDLYVDLVILEERLAGNLSAFESIRLTHDPLPKRRTFFQRFWQRSSVFK